MKALITSVGRRVALVERMKKNFEVFGVDCDPLAPALRFCDDSELVPEVSDMQYLSIVEGKIYRKDINLVIPTLDDELKLWAEEKKYYKIKGVWVSVSPIETIKTCLDKQRLAYFFLDNFPDYFPKAAEGQVKYPAFIKPRFGSGSREAYWMQSRDDLIYYKHCYGAEDYVIQEYLEGQEFTVDCFFSRDNRLISYVPRYREKIRAGVCDRGLTFESEKIERLILQISEKLPFEGAVNFQGKITDKGIKFFEINPRFSGGIQLSIAAGMDPSRYLITEMSGHKLHSRLGKYAKGLRMMGYEKSLFEVAK